jgi:hypothetical protein
LAVVIVVVIDLCQHCAGKRVEENKCKEKRRISVVTIVVKGDAVEFLEWIRNFSTWGSEPRIQWNTPNLAGGGVSDINTATFLHIAEVYCINATALMRDHGRLHMTDQSPRGLSEERVGFHVRRSGTRPETSCLILDEQFANQRFAQTI